MGQGQYVPGGYYLIARKLFDSPIWSENPHILKLFIYLIGKARHDEKPKRYHDFSINRGELVTSLKEIAENNKYKEVGVWKTWSRQRVHRMLKFLEKYGYIKLVPDTYGTHINICNYSYYQDPKIYRPDKCVTSPDRCVTSALLNNNGNNGNNGKKEKRKELSAFPKKPEKAGPPEPPKPPKKPKTPKPLEPFYLTKKKRNLKGWKLETFELFWKTFHWPKDKANAADAWLQIPGLTKELAIKQIIPAAARYCAARPAIIAGNHTPKWAQGWLSSRRWEDEKYEDTKNGLDDFLRRHGKAEEMV